MDVETAMLSEERSHDISPIYTLADHLLVEPLPKPLPTQLKLDLPIRMTPQEIAVALSHIGVWRRIAAGGESLALVLEDDTYFQRGFGRYLEQAWHELGIAGSEASFDILYLSYKEVRHGAQKTLLSEHVFRPVRGLWCLSGYVLSRAGAEKLLGLLPCRGPVDLWINHQFGMLDVRATRRSIIAQRRDTASSNSYSVLPPLARIGVIDNESSSLFQIRPAELPVFAFGPAGSGLSSLAMALSLLGYRCCSDMQELPEWEHAMLLAGGKRRVFDAYVNIGSLEGRMSDLHHSYPQAKFIFTSSNLAFNGAAALGAADFVGDQRVAVLLRNDPHKWRTLCEHLRCAPPACLFPDLPDQGQRQLLRVQGTPGRASGERVLKRDRSPWMVEARKSWHGIYAATTQPSSPHARGRLTFNDPFEVLDGKRWFLRDDTFPGNLAMFRPSNFKVNPSAGATLTVRRETLGVRAYSAASISGRDSYLHGRFEAVIQASSVPGVITGFFLHRDSPRQEIDVELLGHRPTYLLANVFYNPGYDGVRYDYGYRGSPSLVPLGFDASQSAHLYAIEWGRSEMVWLVDGQPVYRRVNWDPTPIPHLPMVLHVNTWPSRSKELAGRLKNRLLPATTVLRGVGVDSMIAST